MAFIIRLATPEDLESLRGIYAYYVLNTISSFEQTPPDLTKMTDLYQKALDHNTPFLVAQDEHNQKL